MLSRLPISFPDRVPKEDHDKILKDNFFYGIRSDLQNSIRHLYDNYTASFLQLLVKARRNEEEEMASKLVNKSAMMDNTLEERVDRLIVKSNQKLPPNPSSRGNPDNSSNYGGPLPQWNQRPEGKYCPRFPRTMGQYLAKFERPGTQCHWTV